MNVASLITLGACCGMALMLWMQDRQIHNLQTEMRRIMGILGSAVDVDGTSLEIELKHADDISHYMAKVNENDLEAFAMSLAEVDEWQIHPDDEKSAEQQKQKLVNDLQTKLCPAINHELDQALSANSGRAASPHIERANALFNIYPQPTDDTQETEVRAMFTKISSTARRIDELRRLRYNEWAVGQIQNALEGYIKHKKILNQDHNALIQSFVEQLGAVDSSHLDPAVSLIYQQALSKTTDALSEPNQIKLAKDLSASSIQRKNPHDF